MVLIKKIAILIWDILLAFLAGAVALGSSLPFSTSLALHCDLESDNTYTCRVSEYVLQYTFSETSYEKVISTNRNLECSGAGGDRSCSAEGEFHTSKGERVIFTGNYTDPDRVQKLVQEVDGAMAAGNTPIDFSGDRFPYIGACLAGILIPAFLLRAFLKLIPSSGGSKVTPLIRFGK
jgi:hypothetical protein